MYHLAHQASIPSATAQGLKSNNDKGPQRGAERQKGTEKAVVEEKDDRQAHVLELVDSGGEGSQHHQAWNNQGQETEWNEVGNEEASRE